MTKGVQRAIKQKYPASHERLAERNLISLCTDDHNIVAAVCTPLMYTVHRLIKRSAEMVFADATGNVDRNNCLEFLLLTHSCVGGLPLGVLTTTGESQNCVKNAWQLFRSRGVRGKLWAFLAEAPRSHSPS